MDRISCYEEIKTPVAHPTVYGDENGQADSTMENPSEYSD